MSGQSARGDRGSQWATFDRCITLLSRLLRGTAKTEELLAIVADEIYGEGDSSPSAIEKRFENDRARLKDYFGCEIKYSRKDDGYYTLVGFRKPLFDLPPDAERGFAFLQTTFHSLTPYHDEVKALLETLKMALPDERLRQIDRERSQIKLDLDKLDSDVIEPETIERLLKAVRSVQVQFTYLSPGQDDEKPRVHRVEPHKLYFSDGHHYLLAYSLESDGPDGPFRPNRWIPFRLGRMKDLQVLNQRFNPDARYIPQEKLIYRLDAKIARGGITQRFEIINTTAQEDKSVIVEAISYDLFRDVRTLLRYGSRCTVLGGDAALNMMKEIVMKMYNSYAKENR